MAQRTRTAIAKLSAVALGLGFAVVGFGPSQALASGPVTLTGTFADGATYLIQVPADWNGTLVLYSHGYVTPGSPNPATDVGDPLTGQWLLANGYALAGSSYATTGWAIQQAIPDQLATLDTFDHLVRRPDRTIAWGHSLGGMITAGLIQVAPQRFTAALPMCGVVAGGVQTWNLALDSALAVQQLLGPTSGLQIVNITDPTANLALSEALFAGAQATPQGQARIALASALGDIPGWFDPSSPEPAPTDYTAQEANQFLWETQIDGPFAFALRAELEARAGGNPSWTGGVNFWQQLQESPDYNEVRALYRAAGLSLSADVATLTAAPRISPVPSAVAYLKHNIVFNGDLSQPVLTLHTTGDGLVVNEDEAQYENTVDNAGKGYLLRQDFISRAGHCTFTPAETIAAFEALIHRVNTGHWGNTSPAALNAVATALGPTYNTVPAAYARFTPLRFQRPAS
ncbi:MAG: alpha/beta hydrolase family protein [Candidatus Dormibacteria bacterium]